MCLYDPHINICGHQTCWRAAGPNRTYQEWVEDTWEAFLNGTEERQGTADLDELGLPKDRYTFKRKPR